MAERIAQAATSISYTASSGTTIFGVVTLNEFVAVVGLMVGFFTAGVNWYYRHKHYQLAKTEDEKT